MGEYELKAPASRTHSKRFARSELSHARFAALPPNCAKRMECVELAPAFRGIGSRLRLGFLWFNLLLICALSNWSGAAIVLGAEEPFANTASSSKLPSGDGLAARFKADAGISQDPAAIFADDFEQGPLGAKWD